MIQDGAYLTNAGADLLAKFISLDINTYPISRVTVGDGVTENAPETMTALVNHKMDAEFSVTKDIETGQYTITTDVISTQNPGDQFYAKEYGIWVKDDSGSDVLFQYVTKYLNYNSIPSSGSTVGSILTQKIIAIISGNVVPQIIIPPSSGYSPDAFMNAYSPDSDINADIDTDGNLILTNTYTLPTASATVLGGVKVGSGLEMDDGVLSANVDVSDCVTSDEFSAHVNDNSVHVKYDDFSSHINDASIHTEAYILPAASANTLGGVKVGERLSINNGVLSAKEVDISKKADKITYTLGEVATGDVWVDGKPIFTRCYRFVGVRKFTVGEANVISDSADVETIISCSASIRNPSSSLTFPCNWTIQDSGWRYEPLMDYSNVSDQDVLSIIAVYTKKS